MNRFNVNNNDLKMLKSLYTSCDSELTAILTYAYQALVVEEDVAKVLREISITEMEHLETLGKIIFSLGAKPTYYTQTQIPWSARCVNYTTDLNKILLDDLKSERKAREEYILVASKISNPEISAQLLEISRNEEKHAQMLEELIKTHSA